MDTFKTDILIVGSGLAGLTAAHHLKTSEQDIWIASTGAGASPFVHGFNVPLDANDTPETFYMDTRQSGYLQNDPALVHALCGDSLSLFEELKQMGLQFDQKPDGSYSLLRPLGSSHPRVVCAGNDTGPRIMDEMRTRLKSAPHVHFAPSVRILRLALSNGRVCGAYGYDEKTQKGVGISAKAVLIACGGLCRIYPFSTNKRDGGGDAAAIAYMAGAEMVDMEFIQFEPSGAVWPEALNGTSIITTLYYDGAVLRNSEGHRFMLDHSAKGEQVDKDIQAHLIAKEIEMGKGTEHNGVYFDATGVGREKLMRDYPAYVNRYEAQGIDLTTQMVEIAPVPHTSLGGVKIDEQGRTTIPGLFVAGEAAGGIHGANRIGGNASLETMVFGRRAAQAIAQMCQDEKALPLPDYKMDPPGEPQDLKGIRQAFGQWMADAAYVLRNGTQLEKVEAEISSMRQALCYTPANETAAQWYERTRLLNDLTAGWLVVSAALMREESVGCHIRTDAKAATHERYRVIAQKDRGFFKQICPTETRVI